MAHRTLFLRLSRPTSCEEAEGSPKFLTLLSLHATLSDPGSPSEISPLRFLRAGFRHVKTVANCIVSIYGAESPRGCTSPLQPAMFSVYASQLLFAYQLGSFSRATLDTGCWLGFARQGLSPYKKRQAALGALTKKSAAAVSGRLDLIVGRYSFQSSSFRFLILINSFVLLVTRMRLRATA